MSERLDNYLNGSFRRSYMSMIHEYSVNLEAHGVSDHAVHLSNLSFNRRNIWMNERK